MRQLRVALDAVDRARRRAASRRTAARGSTRPGRCSMIVWSAWIGSVSGNVSDLPFDLDALAKGGHQVFCSDHQGGRRHSSQSSMSKNYDADVIVAGAGPGGRDRRAAARACGRARARGRTLRRCRGRSRAAAASARACSRGSRGCPTSFRQIPTHAGVEPVSRRTVGRRVPDADATAPPSLLIRRIEFDYLLASLARRGRRAILAPAAIAQAPPGRRRRHAADARRTRAARADGDRRRRRQQRHRAAARHEPRLAAGTARARHDGGDAGRRRSARRSPTRCRCSTATAARTATPTSFPKREHVNVGIGYVLPYFKARVDLTPYDLQQQFVGDLRARGLMDGESQRGAFHAVPDPDRRAAAHDGGGAGAARGRRRRVRQRLLGRGDLLRDGHGRSRRRAISRRVRGGRAGARPARYVRAWRQEIGAELRDSVLIQSTCSQPARMDRVVRVRTRPEFSRPSWTTPAAPVVPRGAAPAAVALPAAAAAPRAGRRRGVRYNREPPTWLNPVPIYRTPALQGWQRTNVVAAANCLREQIRARRTTRNCGGLRGLLDLLDPSRLLARKQREQAIAARHAATAIGTSGARRAPRRRSAQGESRAAGSRAPAGRAPHQGPPPLIVARRPLRSRRHAVRSPPLRARRAEEVHRRPRPRHLDFAAFERTTRIFLEEMHLEVLAGRIGLDDARRERFRQVFARARRRARSRRRSTPSPPPIAADTWRRAARSTARRPCSQRCAATCADRDRHQQSARRTAGQAAVLRPGAARRRADRVGRRRRLETRSGDLPHRARPRGRRGRSRR